jgi:hypothetical protein
MTMVMTEHPVIGGKKMTDQQHLEDEVGKSQWITDADSNPFLRWLTFLNIVCLLSVLCE